MQKISDHLQAATFSCEHARSVCFTSTGDASIDFHHLLLLKRIPFRMTVLAGFSSPVRLNCTSGLAAQPVGSRRSPCCRKRHWYRFNAKIPVMAGDLYIRSGTSIPRMRMPDFRMLAVTQLRFRRCCLSAASSSFTIGGIS